MSYSLYWRPKATKKNNAGKDQGLKWALQKRYGSPLNMTMSSAHIDYLTGLVDGGCPDAQVLIDAIEKHGEIEIFEE